jgi:hypothetical protein
MNRVVMHQMLDTYRIKSRILAAVWSFIGRTVERNGVWRWLPIMRLVVGRSAFRSTVLASFLVDASIARFAARLGNFLMGDDDLIADRR